MGGETVTGGEEISTLRVGRVLCGLLGFVDLHADDVDLGLAVLQHLLCGLQQLFVLSETPYREQVTLLH